MRPRDSFFVYNYHVIFPETRISQTVKALARPCVFGGFAFYVDGSVDGFVSTRKITLD
jgi:hypothetical protein